MSHHMNLELAQSLLEQMPIPTIISDAAKQAYWCNQAFSDLNGAQCKDVVSQPIQQVLTSIFSPVDNRLNTVCTTLGTDTNQRWYEQKQVSLTAENQHYIAHIFADITEAVTAQIEYGKLNKKLEELTTIEPVSGLLNSRAMLQSLEPLTSRSRRYENPLSIIAIELLNITQIIKQHGSTTADEAVVAISYLLKDQLRWADIISRIDNERLVIVLPETEQTDAMFLANKIMNKVSELNVSENDQVPLYLDTCYGVASWKKGNDSQLLLKRTYQALAQSVEKGPQSICEG